MPVIKNTRKAVIAAVILAVIVLGGAVAWFGCRHVIDSRNPYGGHNSYGMRDYTLTVQEKAAKAIVAGLNTGNPDNVELLRFDGHPESEVTNKAIAENISAVLPSPGYQYTHGRFGFDVPRSRHPHHPGQVTHVIEQRTALRRNGVGEPLETIRERLRRNLIPPRPNRRRSGRR